MTLNVHTGRLDPSELESPSPVEQQAAAWQAVWQTLQDVDPNFAAQTGTGKDMVLNSIRGLADRVAQLEAELAAVGAGGVQRLDKSAAQPGDTLIEAVDKWFADNTGLGGCSDKDVAELAAIFAATQPAAQGMGAQATERVAKVVAELFDYPWEHMPEQGREDMRKKAHAIFAAAIAATQPAAQGTDSRDAAFEAVRKAFCKVQRYSFSLDSRGNLRRCADHCGNWVEFEAVHTLFEPQSVDAALAAQADKQGVRQWPEKLGETCMDEGACHHGCTDRCFRRECCSPLTKAMKEGLTMEQWRYSDTALAAHAKHDGDGHG